MSSNKTKNPLLFSKHVFENKISQKDNFLVDKAN